MICHNPHSLVKTTQAFFLYIVGEIKRNRAFGTNPKYTAYTKAKALRVSWLKICWYLLSLKRKILGDSTVITFVLYYVAAMKMEWNNISMLRVGSDNITCTVLFIILLKISNVFLTWVFPSI